MTRLKNFINDSVITVSLSVIGIVATILILAYTLTIAKPVIDQSILAGSYVIGYGGVWLAMVIIFCLTAILLSGSFKVVSDFIFAFMRSLSKSRKAKLKSQFEFKVLEAGQQGYIFSKPGSEFIGRPLDFETSPFMNDSLPSTDPVDIAKWHLLNSPDTPKNRSIGDGENIHPMLEPARPALLNFETVARKALSSRGAGRFIAFGSMGSGKTTLAKHVLDYALDEIDGDVYVIDPHAPKIVWNDNVKVVGAGLDYESIAKFLEWLISDVKHRYELGCGDDSQPLPKPKTFIICEEWNGIIGQLTAKKQWTDEHNRTLYMDARKAGIGYFLVSHEHTVKALGLKGMSNLLGGVEHFISLDKDAITGQYSAKIGNSFRDKNPYDLVTPGAYNGRMQYSAIQAQSELDKSDKYLTFEPTIFDLETAVEPEPEPELPKHHPDNVNAAIDRFLANDPDTFPTKGMVTKFVGVTGGSKYKSVIETYEKRFSDWNNS